MTAGTKPPRGAVTIATTDSGKDGVKHLAECSNCGWCYGNSVRSDVEQHKRWHLCTTPPTDTRPEGTPHAQAQ